MPSLLATSERIDDLERKIIEELNADPLFQHEKGRQLPISCAPQMIGMNSYLEVLAAATAIDGVLHKILEAVITNRDERFAHHAPFERWNSVMSRHGRRLFSSRYDYIVDPNGTFKFIEFNTSCPAGAAFLHKWRSVVTKHVLNHEGTYGVKMPLDDEDYFARQVERIAGPYRDNKRPLHIAIANDNAGLTLELALFASSFQRLGATTTICNLADLKYDGSRLRDQDNQEIDAIYCKVRPTPSLLRGWGPLEMEAYRGFLDAYFNDHVCVLNPFPAMTIGEDKALLACLHDSRYQTLFDADEKSAIERYIPRTWFVDTSNEEVTSMIVQNRSELILKPRMESRGRFIVVGKDVSDKDWQKLITDASNDQWIVQQWLPSQKIESEDPAWSTALSTHSRTMAVFVIDGVPAGIFGRISPSAVNNVGGNGQIQATFVHPLLET